LLEYRHKEPTIERGQEFELGKGFFFFEEQYKEEGHKVKRNQKGKCVRKKEKRQKGSVGMKMKMLPIFIFSKAWMKQNLK
jgi:hypothetical protein